MAKQSIPQKIKSFPKWLKEEILKDQHTPPAPQPVKGEPYWVTRVHQQQEYDFRTGKRNDWREE